MCVQDNIFKCLGEIRLLPLTTIWNFYCQKSIGEPSGLILPSVYSILTLFFGISRGSVDTSSPITMRLRCGRSRRHSMVAVGIFLIPPVIAKHASFCYLVGSVSEVICCIFVYHTDEGVFFNGSYYHEPCLI